MYDVTANLTVESMRVLQSADTVIAVHYTDVYVIKARNNLPMDLFKAHALECRPHAVLAISVTESGIPFIQQLRLRK